MEHDCLKKNTYTNKKFNSQKKGKGKKITTF